MRLTILALVSGLALLPYFGYESGMQADDSLSQHYVATIDGVRERIATFNPKYNFDYEKHEISTTLVQWSGAVSHFVTTLPQRIK